MRPIFTASSVAPIVLAIACAPHRDTSEARRADTTTDRTESIGAAAPATASLDELRLSLDTCNVGHYPSDAPGTPNVRKSTWSTGAIRTVGRVSMFLPDSARLTVSDSTLGAFSFAFSDCPGCRLSVGVAHDSSGKGIEGLVAELIAEQRAVDSANKSHPTYGEEFDVIDGPPTPITVAGERAYVIDDDCGDCAEQRIVFGRPGYIATVHIGSDDDTPMGARHECEMMALGRTFRWRE